MCTSKPSGRMQEGESAATDAQCVDGCPSLPAGEVLVPEWHWDEGAIHAPNNPEAVLTEHTLFHDTPRSPAAPIVHPVHLR